MKKHEMFSEIQEYIGRVPRADEFIEILNGLGKKAFIEAWENIPCCQKLEVPIAVAMWTKNYRAIKYQGQLVCVYQKGSNEDHAFAERTIRRVLNIK